MSLRLWPNAVPDTTVQTLYAVNTLSADWTGKCLFVSIQDIKNRKKFPPFNTAIQMLRWETWEVFSKNLHSQTFKIMEMEVYRPILAGNTNKWKHL